MTEKRLIQGEQRDLTDIARNPPGSHTHKRHLLRASAPHSAPSCSPAQPSPAASAGCSRHRSPGPAQPQERTGKAVTAPLPAHPPARPRTERGPDRGPPQPAQAEPHRAPADKHRGQVRAENQQMVVGPARAPLTAPSPPSPRAAGRGHRAEGRREPCGKGAPVRSRPPPPHLRAGPLLTAATTAPTRLRRPRYARPLTGRPRPLIGRASRPARAPLAGEEAAGRGGAVRLAWAPVSQAAGCDWRAGRGGAVPRLWGAAAAAAMTERMGGRGWAVAGGAVS